MKYTKIGQNYVPVIGQGTCFIGENKNIEIQEINAIRYGIENGINLLDTAEMYGDGLSEILISKAIKHYDRKKIFLVSKVLPNNVITKNIEKSCINSIKRLKTDYLDLYLLHWIGGCDVRYFIDCVEKLKIKQYIKEYGVSNFDTDEMINVYNFENHHKLSNKTYDVSNYSKCVANQVLYNITSRGIEWDLLNLCKKNGTTIMAYCPLALGGLLNDEVFKNIVLKKIAKKHNVSVATIMLNFIIRLENIVAIPKSSNISHIKENIKSMDVMLDNEDLELIDTQFIKPNKKMPLDFE